MRLHEHLMFPSFDSSRSGLGMSLYPTSLSPNWSASHEDFVSEQMGSQASEAHSE